MLYNIWAPTKRSNIGILVEFPMIPRFKGDSIYLDNYICFGYETSVKNTSVRPPTMLAFKYSSNRPISQTKKKKKKKICRLQNEKKNIIIIPDCCVIGKRDGVMKIR